MTNLKKEQKETAKKLLEIRIKVDKVFIQYKDTLTQKDMFLFLTAMLGELLTKRYLNKDNNLSLDEIIEQGTKMMSETIKNGINSQKKTIEERKNND